MADTDVCRLMRLDCLKMSEVAGSSGMHFGGSLSMIEIVYTLYIKKMKVSKDYFFSDARDRVVISKGHGVPAVYAALHQAGIISDDDIATFKADKTRLYGHPSMNLDIGMELSSGSLGQGLSQGIGIALALRHKRNMSSRVYVILGDGECDEGSIWEAAASASHYELNNIIAIVDVNSIQYDGFTREIMNMSPFESKWRAFGWDTISIDGHNIEEILNAYNLHTTRPNSKSPFVILAKTIKGKGVSYMENNWAFHNATLSKEQYEQAISELEG